jgi:hypothetical protein
MPLMLPAGPGRLTVQLSSREAEVSAVLLDGNGKPSRLRLRADAGTRAWTAPIGPGQWRLQSLEVRPTSGEVLLERLSAEVPLTTGLYARAWREGTAAWIELTNLGAAPQPVTVGDAGSASTVDLAPGGRARLPLMAISGASVVLQFAGRKLEVTVRGGGPVAPAAGASP